MPRRVFTAALTAALLLPAGVLAQEDLSGSGDHPDIPRVGGSYIVHFDQVDFDRLVVPTSGWFNDQFESTETLEGELLRISYAFEEDGISTLQIKRTYLQALEVAGFEILFAGSEGELGSASSGRQFLTGGTNIFDRGARDCCHIAGTNHQLRYIAARSADRSVLAGIAIFEAQRIGGPAVSLAAVTADEMDVALDHAPLTVGEMADGILEHGRVAIQNILFAFDSDEILPESSEALATIAELLRERPELSLLVVGHTDSVGDFDYNLGLSMERAAAVVNHLVEEHGIQAHRLQAAGAGMMAPITTNRTEEGQALNRRVELVERPD